MIRLEHRDDKKQWHEFRESPEVRTFIPGVADSVPIIEQRSDFMPEWGMSSFNSLFEALNWFLGRSTWVQVPASAVSVDSASPVYTSDKHKCVCSWDLVYKEGCKCQGI